MRGIRLVRVESEEEMRALMASLPPLPRPSAKEIEEWYRAGIISLETYRELLPQ